jgi:hypothetical protein
VRIHLQTTAHYECDGCGATAPAAVAAGVTTDDLNVSAHEDILRGVAHAERSVRGEGLDLDVPDAWLFTNLPIGWRVTVGRYAVSAGRLRTWVTCSQACVDSIMGRTPETKSAFVEPEPIRGDHVLDYEWRRATGAAVPPGETSLHHLFPIVGDRATDGALCDPDLRVRRGSLGGRLATSKWIECSDCHRLRDGLDDTMGPGD